MPLFESTAFGAAVVFGFRHGFDWDHLAALTDLTGSETRPRRSLLLATWYALGHALMVVALGLLAIVFAEQVPAGVDSTMERVVGASLLALGCWIVWTTVRSGAAAPPRSRWMVAIELVRRATKRLRRDRVVVIEHSHSHGHGHGLHDHVHAVEADRDDRAAVAVTTEHAHLHRHVVTAADPLATYGIWSAFGIGLLHGIGAETPTQVLLFATAANATDTASSVGLLLCFVVGLLGANTVVALAGAFGWRSVARNRVALGVLAALTALFSFVIGALLLAGRGESLPSIFTP
jgi:high-affinity nickel-transport protein